MDVPNTVYAPGLQDSSLVVGATQALLIWIIWFFCCMAQTHYSEHEDKTNSLVACIYRLLFTSPPTNATLSGQLDIVLPAPSIASLPTRPLLDEDEDDESELEPNLASADLTFRNVVIHKQGDSVLGIRTAQNLKECRITKTVSSTIFCLNGANATYRRYSSARKSRYYLGRDHRIL
jgi:hypothetical protein